MHIRFALIIAAAVAAVGCYKLDIGNGQLRCSVPDKKCPSSFYCALDGYCWKNGQSPNVDMENTTSNSSDMLSTHAGDMLLAADMAQGPPAANKGGVVLSGGVTAQSPSYKIIMSTGQSPGGNINSSSSSYNLKSGLPALNQ